jgi:hypothetical protein
MSHVCHTVQCATVFIHYIDVSDIGRLVVPAVRRAVEGFSLGFESLGFASLGFDSLNLLVLL